MRAITLGIPDLTDPSEGRFASMAQEMLLAGDWDTPRVHIQERGWVPYLAKPPLHVWLMAGSFSLFGSNTWAARLPALISTLLTLAAMMAFARRFFGARQAALSCLVLVSTVGGFFLGAAAVTDPGLVACFSIAVAQFGFLCEERESAARRETHAVCVAAALGFGMLVKGPVCPALFGLTVGAWLVWTRRIAVLTSFDWRKAAVIFTVIWLPWYLLAELRNPGFLRYFLVQENFMRYLTKSAEISFGSLKTRPRFIVWPIFLGLALPWSLAALACLWKRIRGQYSGPGIVSSGGADQLRLAWCWFLAPMLFFSGSRTLLPTYALPALPGFCVLLAVYMPAPSSGAPRYRNPALVATGGVMVYVVALLASASYMNDVKSSGAIFRWLQGQPDRPRQESVALLGGRESASAWFYYRMLDGAVLASYEPRQLEEMRSSRPDRILVRSKELAKLDPATRDLFEIVHESRGWIVARQREGIWSR